MDIQRFRHLFQRYINKQATNEEVSEFMSMVEQGDYKEEVYHLLNDLWNTTASGKPMPESKKEMIFRQIIQSQDPLEPIAPPLHRRRWLQVAAVFFVIGFSVLFYHLSVQSPEAVISASKSSSSDYMPEWRFINLPDGSSVVLSHDSKLEIGEGFNMDGKREVYLSEGEAYFDVVHDVSNPFVVHTGKLQTTVLGTAFNIKANSATGTVTVTVARGKVKVGDETQTFNIIDPDEQVTFNEHIAPVAKKINAEQVLSWKNEDIYFDDVNLSDVTNQLQERFDISIVFNNESIKNCRFSATFLKKQTLEQILDVISEFNHIKYQFVNKDTILLKGSGCRQ